MESETQSDASFDDISRYQAILFESIGAEQAGNVPLPEIISTTDVRQEANARSEDIFQCYDTLHKILQRHEATIQRRWLKKNRRQRVEVLNNAWPSMAGVHRPDFAALRRESEAQVAQGTKLLDSFMWPYINQEDLSTNNALPLLLNARGLHSPSHFAAADLQAMQLGIKSNAIVPIFLDKHIIILNGFVENDRKYGELICWSGNPTASMWMEKKKQFLAGDGLLILKAQARLLSFLVKCCRQILHDHPEASLTSDSVPILPDPQFNPNIETTGFESLRTMAAEAPYRVPAQLDLDGIASLLAARTSAAEDHLWALREDPGYFTTTILDYKEHRLEIIKDLNGRDHPVLGRHRHNIFWARILGTVVIESYLCVELFAELSHQARALVSLQKRYAGDICPSRDLPEKLLEALLRFHHYLTQAVKGPLGVLRVSAVASPPLRRHFVRKPPADRDSPKVLVVAKLGKKGAVETELMWLLHMLWEKGDASFFDEMPLFVDELERMIESERGAQELITSYLSKVIGDISIISQCLNQLALYQPWARTWESDLEERQEKLKQEYEERTEPWVQMHLALKDLFPQTIDANEAIRLGDPTGNKIVYPIGKRRNKKNVEDLRQSERRLDAFWVEIDKAMAAKVSRFRGTAVQALLDSEWRILQRTGEWEEPENQHQQSQSTLHTHYEPIPSVYSNTHPGGSSEDISQPQKIKVKTRGTPRPLSTQALDVEALQQEDDRSDVQPTFSVDARAYNVFQTLFFDPAVTTTPGEVPWSHFLHAMSAAGFTAMKLYGSVWQFQPTNLNVERSIQFHEPHPRGKLPFTTARRYGRRLNRAYGWEGKMFVPINK
ncbi:uncharacterized protein BO97DRAFT_449852 [Aspergillus homomorphus CBS 101889]|uniref:Uncharacterized protein n=1 Tax=Aspergillus homomorphus (strain CBS 101889) TaxID=1450537 RepID=A0A395I1Y8_ASPHC|nr:hypothetical protein BO97DRAFT_449852 [Aspergillus homomorphus CBS 101889]RAL13726.1 hypothetical protein BO97DRAFT_449852 [Aspergillus homomorphus CBS 101889]